MRKHWKIDSMRSCIQRHSLKRCAVFIYLSTVSAFLTDVPHKACNIQPSPSHLKMGLYDQPLPPRPSPRNSNNSGGDDEEEEDSFEAQRLFAFNTDGTEVRGWLPRLSRTLESGIDCYFEATDRIVQNLVSKTDCHPEDAAWALEACKGDITEAWTCISTARRQQLIGEDDSLSSEVSQLMAENDFEILKEERMEQERKRKRDEFFKSGTPDEDWLPTNNPRPIDDEPWFTG